MDYQIVGTSQKDNVRAAILTPVINSNMVSKHYYGPYLSKLDENVMVCDLYRNPAKKKTPASEIKEYMEDLIEYLFDDGIKLLIVTQPEYFKVITKQPKTDAKIGDVIPTIYTDDDGTVMYATYCPNYARVFYDPVKIEDKIKIALRSAVRWLQGDKSIIGKDIIKTIHTPETPAEIEHWLNKLIEMNVDLTCDTENFSLKHFESGVGTITFCWNKHEGVVFPIDYQQLPEATKFFGKYVKNQQIRDLLKKFFIRFRKKIIYHNVCYDAYILIYNLFMNDILDQKGLLVGLSVMLRNWDCTQLISYLATNSCAGNELSLKAQAQEYAGNYAQEDIKDIRKIPLPVLLKYNLIDGLATWFVFEKNHPIMVKDQQEDFYRKIFKPAVVDVIQMQLTGMPVNIKKVKKLNKSLKTNEESLLDRMNNIELVSDFIEFEVEAHVLKKNTGYKKKVITVKDVKPGTIVFNPNSAPQLQKLLYDENFLGLPVLDTTASRLPATGAETLEKLINHTEDTDVKALLELLIEYKAQAIILSTFLPAMLNAQKGHDGWHYLFGSFRLGGTKSGRLSSANPNLQNIPSAGSTAIKRLLAKLIKECFQAPPGWLFVGLDFDSLEDKISAVTTNDPEKIKVYSDGYDGHCLRAYSYFGNEMPDIDPSIVKSINSIKHKYKDLRQKSKAPTFALTYQGTYITLMNNCGFTKELAQSIEKSYHKMYHVSDKYIADKIKEATKTGYVTLAFGLRLRTPLLKQVIIGNSKTPYEASAEGRTAGNALGQSWCMLNSRAGSEFLEVVRANKYRLDIKPCSQIHDAQYYLVKDDAKTLEYVNKHLVKAVSWQKDSLIQNEHINMSGELSIFYPDWSKELVIPNGATAKEIKSIAVDHARKLAA